MGGSRGKPYLTMEQRVDRLERWLAMGSAFRCSFCGREREKMLDDESLLIGPVANICNRCIKSGLRTIEAADGP